MNRRACGRDEAAVSTVIGAILLFALIVLVVVMIRTTFVPAWEEDREERHMGEVQSSLLILKGATERAGGNSSFVDQVIPLHPGDVSFLFPSGLTGGTLSFEPDSAGVHWESSELRIATQNGRSLAGADEEWVDIAGIKILEDVTDVSHLRLRIEDPEAGDDGDAIHLIVTDANNNPAGQLTAYIDRHPSGYSVRILVLNAAGNTVYDQGESFFQQDQPPYYYVDALAFETHFGAVLASAQTPFTIDVEEDGLTGDVSAVYVAQQAGGGVIVGSSGLTVPDWELSATGGRIHFAGQNQRFIAQELWLENGALILEQQDGAVFVGAPGFRVTVSGGSTAVSVTMPNLVGDGISVSGSRDAVVTASAGRPSHITATAPDWSMTVDTQHPALWASFWTRALEDAGLSVGSGHFAVTQGPDWASVTISGTDAGAAHDISLQISQVPNNIRIQT